jgi:peptidoglycan hydrolase CwlO-like protein
MSHEKPWEYDGRIIALTRNVESLDASIKYFEKKRAEDAKRVEDLMMTITQLTQQIQALNQKTGLMQAQLYEAGVR